MTQAPPIPPLTGSPEKALHPRTYGSGGKQQAIYRCGCAKHAPHPTEAEAIRNPKVLRSRTLAENCPYLKLPKAPLLIKGKPTCQKYPNRWLRIDSGRHTSTRPLACGSWNCHYCNDAKAKALTTDLFEALHHAVNTDKLDGGLPSMQTFTWRHRNRWTHNFETPEAAERWRLMKEDPKALLERCHADVRAFMKRYKRAYDADYPWTFWGLEATPIQGFPHIHMVVHFPKHWTKEDYAEYQIWATYNWHQITKDSTNVVLTPPDEANTRTLKGAYGYAMKYVRKDLARTAQFQFPHMRRYGINRNLLERPFTADITAFFTPDGVLLPRKEMNREAARIHSKSKRIGIITPEDATLMEDILYLRSMAIQKATFIVDKDYIYKPREIPPLLCCQYYDGTIYTRLSPQMGREDPLKFLPEYLYG